VRGQRFFERPEVRDALRLLRRLGTGPGAAEAPRGSQLLAAFDARLRADLGFEAEDHGGGTGARERTANLALVLGSPARQSRSTTSTSPAWRRLRRPSAAEAEGSGDG
jgi:hypothetical protein